MKTTTLTRDSSAGLTLTQHDIKITLCAHRLEFMRGDDSIKVSAETLHKVLDDWLDIVRTTRRVSGQAPVR